MDGTTVLDTYKTSYYAGQACLTERKLGKGRVIHLGSAFSRERTRWLLAYTGIIEPFAAYVTAPEDIQLVMREKDGRRFLFVLNFMPYEQTISLLKPSVLLYTGETVDGHVTLPRFGTAVYELV